MEQHSLLVVPGELDGAAAVVGHIVGGAGPAIGGVVGVTVPGRRAAGILALRRQGGNPQICKVTNWPGRRGATFWSGLA
jgi:hypothetical protein